MMTIDVPAEGQCAFIPEHVFDAITKAENLDDASKALASQAIHLLQQVNSSSDIPGIESIRDALFGQKPFDKTPVNKVHRKVYTLSHKQSEDIKDASLVRDEDGPPSTSDIAVDKCYEFLGDTFRFFNELFGRNSIDDRGLVLVGLTHYGMNYPNALWDNNLKLMWLGDGYQKDAKDDSKPAHSFGGYFGNYYNSLEVVAHELMHGITHDVANLYYWGESGALNEHLSDAFGLMIKHYKLKQSVEDADWLVGRDIILPELTDMAFRSFKDPGNAYKLPNGVGKDIQVKHMRDFNKEYKADYGGVHIYSGIPNHAFYLAAITIGGYSWQKLGYIWWNTLKNGNLNRFCTFSEFATKTVDFAKEYGRDVQDAITEAWQAVGVEITPVTK